MDLEKGWSVEMDFHWGWKGCGRRGKEGCTWDCKIGI